MLRARNLSRLLPAFLLGAALIATASIQTAQAQGGGHGGGPPGGGGGGMPGGGLSRNPFPGGGNNIPMYNPERHAPGSGDGQGTIRGGLQLGPPGRWWDDRSFARVLGLDSAQQHRMDDVFNTSKPTLVKLYKTLQHEESQLEKVTRAKNPDEAEIFQQIDRVTQARGEVEKAYAHMLLSIRKEMTPEQIGRLEDHSPATE